MAFINDYAALLAPWGLAPAAGRVFAYLLLKQVPVSVDDIASDLGMSRVGAWNSARGLETFGHVRRHGVAGSKKALYSPSDNFTEPLMRQVGLIADLATLLHQAADSVASPQAINALEERASFYSLYSDEVRSIIDNLNAARQTTKTQTPGDQP